MMQAILDLDQMTMFTVNALLLTVFAVAFMVAGLGQKDRTYWSCMIISNIVFAAAFYIFSNAIGGTATGVFIPNILLFIGLSCRWVAIRAFFGRTTSLVSASLSPIAAVFVFVLWPFLGNGLVFAFVNLLITLQIVAIMWAIVVENERLRSRWGLIISYAVLVFSSLLRVQQGWSIDTSMESLLPSDVLLELHLIAAAIHISASGAFSLSIAYERSVNSLRETALRDPLTGLFNRRSIETLFEVASFKNDKRSTSLIMIDIDHFKRINDTYGHATGDAALKHCADLLKSTFLNYKMIARVGGEEFMVLLPGKTANAATLLSEEFQEELAQSTFAINGQTIQFTVSIGISSGHITSHSEFEAVWDMADKALYRAKKLGRNTAEIFAANPSHATS